MTVQGTVYGGTWRYMAVQESVKLPVYILVCTGTYLFLLFNLVPAGFAAAMLPRHRRSDGVDDEGEDLSNGLGGDVRHGLVVRCCYGGENSVQEGSYGQVR